MPSENGRRRPRGARRTQHRFRAPTAQGPLDTCGRHARAGEDPGCGPLRETRSKNGKAARVSARPNANQAKAEAMLVAVDHSGLPVPSANLAEVSDSKLANPWPTISPFGTFVTSFLQVSAGTCAGVDLNDSFSPLGAGSRGRFGRGARGGVGRFMPPGGGKSRPTLRLLGRGRPRPGRLARRGRGLARRCCGRACCVRAGAVAFACGR